MFLTLTRRKNSKTQSCERNLCQHPDRQSIKEQNTQCLIPRWVQLSSLSYHNLYWQKKVGNYLQFVASIKMLMEGNCFSAVTLQHLKTAKDKWTRSNPYARIPYHQTLVGRARGEGNFFQVPESSENHGGSDSRPTTADVGLASCRRCHHWGACQGLSINTSVVSLWRKLLGKRSGSRLEHFYRWTGNILYQHECRKLTLLLNWFFPLNNQKLVRECFWSEMCPIFIAFTKQRVKVLEHLVVSFHISFFKMCFQFAHKKKCLIFPPQHHQLFILTNKLSVFT